MAKTNSEENSAQESEFETKKIDSEDLLPEEGGDEKATRKIDVSQLEEQAAEETPSVAETVKVDAEELLAQVESEEPAASEIQMSAEETPSIEPASEVEMQAKSVQKEGSQDSGNRIWLAVIIGLVVVALACICSCAALFGYMVYTASYYM